MFNLFSKSKKKKANGSAPKKANGKATAKKKVKKKQAAPMPPDQTVQQAAEKLEAARRRLDDGEATGGNLPPRERQKLIEQALAVHKVQSKLLDDLDDDTRHRLKTLAMEKMVFKKDK